jgi:hypothetical protein
MNKLAFLITNIWKDKLKSNKRSIAVTITKETKREGQRKAKKCIARKNQKKGEI